MCFFDYFEATAVTNPKIRYDNVEMPGSNCVDRRVYRILDFGVEPAVSKRFS
jgi:hypothetical protein